MATLLLRAETPVINTNELSRRIQSLKANQRETDPAWWNDLAGAYLRIGQPREAANLLEPIISRFPDDYGVHANLGTAYHLLGRYAEAEREIARDLELNPNAHFGLEVYHLALLQYLSRDNDYRANHVFVDEFTPGFLEGRIMLLDPVNGLAGDTPAPSGEIEDIKQSLAKLSATDSHQRRQLLVQLAALDPPPAYRYKWNLAHDSNFEKGVRYMAELNPAQPACFVMAALACLHAGDMNLGVVALKRAISLGSSQRQLLDAQIASIEAHIRQAKGHRSSWRLSLALVVVVLAVIGAFFVWFLLKLTRS